MIITGDDEKEMAKLRKNLFSEFEMKDLGLLKYFLGIEVLRSKRGIFINQKKYILDLFVEVRMLDCKPADTPIRDDAKLADRGRYKRLVGKLIYLSYTTPDIAYVVGVVSQFMHSPQEEHWQAVLRVVRYLKMTAEHGLLFKKHGYMEVHGFTDAGWAGNPNDRKSTAGYFTFVGGNLVIWKSKKQKVVAIECRSRVRGIKSGLIEILWLRRLMTELDLLPSQPYQLADILTKAVNSKSFQEVLGKLSIGNLLT
ncbi:hypothetical protein AAHA92_06584 [Salvia divinorum]|uniref:Reverse transcriptase Ty1/copia-type domain-containing protein n=1 Tax=Salvia divinorum TaxID=28513 RepID=A0ABD1I648_SALDI